MTQPDGTVVELTLTGDEHAHVTADALGREVTLAADGFWRPTGQTAAAALRSRSGRTMKRRLAARKRAAREGTGITSFPRTGAVRSLVVLVDFPDIPFVTPDVHREFNEMLNLEGFDRREHIGSAADYFRTQSLGQFSPQFDVYGPVRADHNAAYYGENDANGDDARAHELAMEVCRKLDSEIDFADYDLDGDGVIDNVYMFYAGYGENFAGNKASWIWPHANHIDFLDVPREERTYDGKVLNSYGCCAELYGSTGRDVAAIGTFCHEFGHILGLPDTYDVNYSDDGSAYHPGEWDIMASGSYLPATRNSGAVPAGYSALERWLLGWADPVDISRPQNVTLPPLNESAISVRISTEHPDEFFLLENRQQTSGTYDRYLPSHGMLVWHVDRRADVSINVTIAGKNQTISCADAWNLEYNAVNMNPEHMCLEIEKASGNSGSKSSQDTPFPGRQMITSFTDATSPAMTSWSGQPTGKPVTDIRELAGDITFSFMGGSDRSVMVDGALAEDVTASGFTARWNALPEAEDGFIFRLYGAETTSEHGVVTLDEGFASLPDGWSITSDSNFSGGALELGGSTASTLSSPLLDLSSGGALTVRSRQTGSSAGTLTVKCGDTVIDEFIPTDNASNYTVTIAPQSSPAAISLVTERRKAIAIEPVTMLQDVEHVALTAMPAYTATLPAGSTGHTVDGLTPGRYAFTVEAAGYAGSASPLTFADLGDDSPVTPPDVAVDAAEADTPGAPAEYFRIDGTRAGVLTPGIYIVRRGATVKKVIIN